MGCLFAITATHRFAAIPHICFIGTDADNTTDKTIKGRVPRGETHYKAKLTDDAVRAILADPRTCGAIAPDYGVSEALIGYVKQRKIWKHVTVTSQSPVI